MMQRMRLGAAVIGLALAVIGSSPVSAQMESFSALQQRIDQLHVSGKYDEAIPLAEKLLELTRGQKGEKHPHTATCLNTLATLYQAKGRYAEAEPLYKRSLTIREAELGNAHPEVATTVGNLAGLYRSLGRYVEAEPLYKRSLAIRETALGGLHTDVGTSLNNLALLYWAQGRYAEAEPLYKRSLAIHENAHGPDHPHVATSLNNLAELYKAQGRYAEAVPLSERDVAISTQALGPEHPDVGKALGNLAGLYEAQARYSDAEPLYKRSLALVEKALGADHADVGTALVNLADVYLAQGLDADAEPLYKRSLALYERVLGREHPYLGMTLGKLADVYLAQRRYAEAEPLYKRSLAISKKALGPDHPDVGTSLSDLAGLYFSQYDWARAADHWQRSTDVIVRRSVRGTGGTERRKTSEAARSKLKFIGLAKAVYRLASKGDSKDATLSREMFRTAQWASASEAALALAQMAVRGSKGDPWLGGLMRDRQDLAAEWQKRDAARTAAVSQTPNNRNREGEAANLARLAAIDTAITSIDKRLLTDFPDYAALALPRPLSVDEVRSDLRPDEALLLFLDTPERKPTPEETFIWVVTKQDMRWVRSSLGATALVREVAALRCGLDAMAWNEGGAERCANLLDLPPKNTPAKGQPLPFNALRAHALYKALFGEIADLIAGKNLLFVPSGALTQLPFQVLITAPPNGNYATARWLAREHAITVLPTVSSLKALRRVAHASVAKLPMIGFGNPLLDGDQSHPQYGEYYKRQAALARAQQSCSKVIRAHLTARAGLRGSVEPVHRRGGADLTQLRTQSPLPETAKELCDVAAALKAERQELRLGSRATEREIKTLSESGALANYRIVHFATHGTLAGQLSDTAEPGLILTPPSHPTNDDDGYLSASEIAALKLDADWVILSACNTAGAADTDKEAQALSGLARAFFYAGTRALLASHWEVDTDAAVALITTTVKIISGDARIGRSEGLRRAMLEMIDYGKPEQAHPSYWAPFALVGEGAAAR